MIPTPLLLKAAPYAVALGLGLAWFRDHDRQVARTAVIAQTLKIKEDSLVGARLRGDSLLSQHRTDTLRLTRTLTRRDTVLQTVDRLLRDTVPVPVEVVREVVRADSVVIQACRSALVSCEEITSNLCTQLSLTTQQRDLWQRRGSSSFTTRARVALTWAGVGYLVGRSTAR